MVVLLWLRRDPQVCLCAVICCMWLHILLAVSRLLVACLRKMGPSECDMLWHCMLMCSCVVSLMTVAALMTVAGWSMTW